MLVLLVFALIPFVFAVVTLRRAYAAVAVNDVSAVIASGRLDDTPSVRLLIDRSLSRARRFRTTSSVAAWAGVLAVIIARSISGAGELRISFAGLFVAGIAGYLGGAILGETHQLRRVAHAVRVASVSPRSVSGYRSKYLHVMLIAGATAAIAVSGASAVIGSIAGVSDPHVASFVTLGAAAAVVAAIVMLMQHRVVWRARPALPEPLRRADDTLRTRAFATLDAAGSALAWMLASIALAEASSTARGSMLRLLAGLGSLFVACVAVMLALRARRVAWPAPA